MYKLISILLVVFFAAPSFSASEDEYKYILTSITALQHDTQHLKTQFTAVHNATISNEQIVFQIRELQREINNLYLDIKKVEPSQQYIENNKVRLTQIEEKLNTLLLQAKGIMLDVDSKLNAVPLINDKYKAQIIDEAKEATFSKITTLFSFLTAGLGAIIGIAGWGINLYLQSNLSEKVQVYRNESEQVQHNIEDGVIANRSFAALGPHSTISDRVELVIELRKRLLEDPGNRLFAILIGRMLRKDENYTAATEELNKFVEFKEKEEEIDHDLADILYNRACYKTLASECNVINGDNEVRLKSAFEDLKRSASINRNNFTDAEMDVDLELLRQQPYYKDWASTLLKTTSHQYS